MINLQNMTTETVNANSTKLSELSIIEAVKLMNNEDINAVKCIESEIPQITKAIEAASIALNAGGRIIYIGAGTSGRLGVLDAVECPPTFGVDYNTVVGLMAGGSDAFVKAKEGAEDSFSEGKESLIEAKLTDKDVVIGIAASGRTPFVIGGLDYAKSINAKTITVSCNKNSEISNHSDIAIEACPGPEVLTGSTRLKAGTTTKLILNMISTLSMVQFGKVFKNYMVDLKMTNEKLIARGINIVSEAAECDKALAKEVLEKANGHVKLAIVMILLNITLEEAQAKLEIAHGHIHKII